MYDAPKRFGTWDHPNGKPSIAALTQTLGGDEGDPHIPRHDPQGTRSGQFKPLISVIKLLNGNPTSELLAALASIRLDLVLLLYSLSRCQFQKDMYSNELQKWLDASIDRLVSETDHLKSHVSALRHQAPHD